MAGPGKKPKRRATFPWERRQSLYQPLTAMDKLIDSPLRAVMLFVHSLLVSLRGAPFQPHRSKPTIRIVCISDTHSNIIPVAHGDVLIHAGDLTNKGTVEEIQAQLDWLDSLPHKEKIVIAGNHDSYFDTESRRATDIGKELDLKSIHYLENESLTLKFKGGRELNFYGSPDIPQCGGSDFAFQYPRDLPSWETSIPLSTDVLITHSPPRYHRDLNLGCAGLLERIWQVRPKLHVFGHIHSGHGREAVFWDEGQKAYERLMDRKTTGILADLIPSSAWLDALKIVWYGIKGILWQRLMVGPAGGNGGLLLNAAVVYQTTSDVGNTIQVVEL
ncbi:hypothetical protein HYALB_00008843 [Hymenoscyphus albidus]|uniref:Calcineurin-like phosphoesterase domain-containing protein n=1 Tax=Hymenoscyphus albidus TaxID=595503 RepID=A0A9N9LPG4_9HELO|nr:hypothetical protein HYALB_00008843 [Hymenoscyphus albidus]